MADQTRLFLTTSWDDGHPADEKLADLLDRIGVGASFYVPQDNREGRPVLDPGALARLAGRFEIGGHTQSHVDLTSIPASAIAAEIRDGKAYLEDATGAPVPGFCYPRGGHNAAARAAVVEAGFAYARTTANLCLDPGRDRFRIPTSMQFYNHPPTVRLRNYVRRGRYAHRAGALIDILTADDLVAATERLARRALASSGVLHIWGHSWEIDAFNLWESLETALRAAIAVTDVCETGSNHEIYRRFFPELTS